MYKNKTKEIIDTELEINAIVEYISKKWEGYEQKELKELLKNSWDNALKKFELITDENGFFDAISIWSNERKNKGIWEKMNPNITQEEIKLVSVYDNIYNTINNIFRASKSVKDYALEKWDYDKEVKQEVKSIVNCYPDFKNIKPIGWKKLAKGYEQYDGMHSYAEKDQIKDEKEFKGCDSSGATNGGFTIQVSLPTVMYNDKEKGRSPIVTLIGAIFSHAYFVAEHNNTQIINNELNKVKKILSEPDYYQKLQYKVEFESLTENKNLKLLFALAKDEPKNSKEEFEAEITKNVNHMKNPPVLSDEEKKNNQEKIKKMMSQFFSSVKSPSDEEIKKYKKEKEEKFLLIDNLLKKLNSPRKKM